MSVVEHLIMARLRLLGSIEPKEAVENVVFTFRLKHNKPSDLCTYLLPIVGKYQRQDKVSIANHTLQELRDLSFFSQNGISIENNETAVFFFFDPQNLIDYCYTLDYKDNVCFLQAYDLNGKIVVRNSSAISKSENFIRNQVAEPVYYYTPESFEKTQVQEVEIQKDSQSNLKENRELFKSELANNEISCLYHFTDRSNLSSIVNNGGLYSWKSCEINGIDIISPGGDNTSRSLDSYYGLDDFVRLSFVSKHPMMFAALKQDRISDPVVLKVSTDVVLWKETRFSDMNATRNGHNEGPTINDFRSINFSVLKRKDYFSLEEQERQYYQAEVLVKSFIPMEFISIPS